MISDNSIRYFAELFNGDIDGLYGYKSGGNLVSFFNSNYGMNDSYGQGFPSRWVYTHDKLVNLHNSNKMDSFLTLILGNKFIMGDSNINEVEAIEKGIEVLKKLNEIFKVDGYIVVKRNEKYYLVEEEKDLKYIGGGGFAKVYKRESTGVIVKKLKDEFLADRGIRSRFKNEFEITKSLGNVAGIINVYEYFEDSCSYSMEEGELTLQEYVEKYDLTHEYKLTCIRQVLYIMGQVHSRDIIHRDISPNNVLLFSGMLKISDFGLGKDLNILNSHQTVYTNAVGQFSYCAPEQFMLLKNGDKKSDVYSLGRLINFIMTKDPNNYQHILRGVIEKATSSNSIFRYNDANELLKNIEKSIKYHENTENTELVKQKALSGIIDIDVESFIYELNGEKLCSNIIDRAKFIDTLINFMGISEERSLHIVQGVSENYKDNCKEWDDYDPIANLMYRVIKGTFTFTVKEIAAIVMHEIAYGANRFGVRDLVKNLIEEGVDPMLEEILSES
ncbi:protein kinase [Clostridium estertheticum]|uniref:Protein kinase n=1 Tax=Clostridium estertheticum TaxID=238834 RepID=A0AA47ELV6_9CLOT|nr:protein kinase [Clostridium estertheticum]MBU3154629.1 protein kinase [Clostridium estertheticum]MBU3198775.1 protein kinase [Clostridium estertheticum]WAG61789.1 protein kinase [Clostridium estertheticum]WAG64089.1 protein kinase [Clostridium estertheticum]